MSFGDCSSWDLECIQTNQVSMLHAYIDVQGGKEFRTHVAMLESNSNGTNTSADILGHIMHGIDVGSFVG